MTISMLESQELRTAFSAYPTGVAVVAAEVDGVPVGLVATSFTSVSLDPPLASVCIARTSRTWQVLQHAQRLGVSVLTTEQQHAVRALAAREGDRFASVSWRANRQGAVHLDGAGAWFDTSVDQVVTAGDHYIVVLAIHDLHHNHEASPLVFHGSRFTHLAS